MQAGKAKRVKNLNVKGGLVGFCVFESNEKNAAKSQLRQKAGRVLSDLHYDERERWKCNMAAFRVRGRGNDP